jgi:two-component system chemotaxis sensor kinase CheA
MIDEVGDPLIHMVRNSADHGIESPEVRLAAGKPEQGTVTLDAFHRGNSIYIRVSDDGKGLDSERIKAKALERGLISQVEAERMTKQQIFQLIWEPGLSTAEKVTEVSGRGMGMDIVKSKIELLNGTVELDSEIGKGTTVTIKLPLTLAILPSLMVSIDGDIFAMPLESVVEIINVSPKDICTVHCRPTARVRGRVVSMVELRDVFSWHSSAAGSINENAADNSASTLVIINENGRELGLAVDHVIGEQDIVIKSMAENYRNVQGVAGASILGDGRVSLIFDLAALIDMATSQKVNV